MTNPTWHGVSLPSSYHPQINEMLQNLANSARDGDWQRMIDILRQNPEFIHATRPGGTSLYTSLHQAAYNGAPIHIVQELISLGAWRTLCTLHGERPVDLARQHGHHELVEILEPVYLRQVDQQDVIRMQEHFHAVIRKRVDSLVEKHKLRLPPLEPLVEMEQGKIWFPVPEMYGGFRYWLKRDGNQPLLISESWSRVVGGSEQWHEITPQGLQQVKDGDDYWLGNSF